MADYSAILALVLEHRSYSEIVEIVGCSRREVSAVSRTVKDRGITSGQAASMTRDELSELFPDGRKKVSAAFVQPDFAAIVKSMKANPHYTLQQGWHRYVQAPTAQGKKYGYTQFCQLFNDYAAVNDVVATLHHEPGRAMLVDWAGDTLAISDEVTGEITKAYLFVAVLPYSGMVFCRAFTDMKQQAWNSAHVQAFEAYGGVTPILVPDNAATATNRPNKEDSARVVNASYRELAEHYSAAVVPARPKRPRHKAAAESAVNVANKRILGYLNEELWRTLAELNAAVDERVVDINERIKRADGSTRGERFVLEEAHLLQPLPAERFESVQWKQLKAGKNYHVTADYQHYSVPYQLVGRILKVRLTGAQVTVFDGESVACEHPRKHGRKGQYSTLAEHVPKQHQNLEGLWSGKWFLDRARPFGPATVTVIEMILARPKIEAQAYLDCQNILMGLGKKNRQRLDAACQQVLNQHGYPTYTTLKRLMASMNSDAQRVQAPLPAASTTKRATANGGGRGDVFVRGADYYRDGR
ncbi:IS21 family transposase [Arthrobacter rhombi]|uniref:IS21 family transposase n=1 Tax=Arthrobacter rhombi TaxID=71253 RepID=UPI003FD28260